jgi:hypothetical protein
VIDAGEKDGDNESGVGRFGIGTTVEQAELVFQASDFDSGSGTQGFVEWPKRLGGFVEIDDFGRCQARVRKMSDAAETSEGSVVIHKIDEGKWEVELAILEDLGG